MIKKKYTFRLPEIKEIGLEEKSLSSEWISSQAMPVYALIPACATSDSMIVTELECYIDPADP